LSYIFCSDAYLLSINQQYLQHDYFTDIITFSHQEAGKISGDLYISVERVLENSSLYNGSYIDELHRVMVHGVLHLCGYGDKSPAEEKKMRETEDFYLKQRSNKLLGV
jgi:probable rRNA maturation factor